MLATCEGVSLGQSQNRVGRKFSTYLNTVQEASKIPNSPSMNDESTESSRQAVIQQSRSENVHCSRI